MSCSFGTMVSHIVFMMLTIDLPTSCIIVFILIFALVPVMKHLVI